MLTRQRLSAALQLTSSEVFCFQSDCETCTPQLVDSYLGEGDETQVWVIKGRDQVLRVPKDTSPVNVTFDVSLRKHLFLTQVLNWENVLPCLVIPCLRGVQVHNAHGRWCSGSVVAYDEESQTLHDCVEQGMDVVPLLIALCECLQRLRSLLQFSHNDMHMKNVLVRPNGDVTLIDVDSCSFQWRGFAFGQGERRSPGFDLWCLFRDLFRNFPLADPRLALEKKKCQVRRNMFKFRPSIALRRLNKLK